MGSRSRMRHNIFFQRNSASIDAYGGQGSPIWDDLSITSGHVWAVKEDTIHGRTMSPVIGNYRAIVPLSTDVTENDRIEKVENRADSPTVLFGKMDIDAVIRRKDHFELRMRGFSGC